MLLRLVFFTLLFLSVNSYVMSQVHFCETGGSEVFLTDSCINIPGIYEARDRVRLKYGYRFNVSNGVMKARLNNHIVLDHNYTDISNVPDISNIDIETDLSVGLLPASINVNNKGAGQYNIPIKRPLGAAGVEPQISVSYNSQSGVGELGIKWYLSGISKISRVPQKEYYDGQNSALNATNQDRFALDGVRLLPKNGCYQNYGRNNFEYEKEITDFSKIVSYSSNNDNGPCYFIVKTRNGLTMEYGKSEDSKLIGSNNQAVLVWNINKVSDRNGNYIKFKYNNSNNECVVSEIHYTGNEEKSPTNTITFIYDKKGEDKNRYYVTPNNYVNNTKILNSIIVKSYNSIFRKYKFSYFFDGMFSKLYKIQKIGSNGEEVNPTFINYGKDGHQETAHTMSLPNSRNKLLFLGDFNANGKTDALSLENVYDTTEVIISSEESFKFKSLTGHNLELYNNFSNSTAINFVPCQTYYLEDPYLFQPQKRSICQNSYYLSDFTGDFKDNLIVMRKKYKSEYIFGFSNYSPLVGSGFSSPSNFPSTSLNYQSNTPTNSGKTSKTTSYAIEKIELWTFNNCSLEKLELALPGEMDYRLLTKYNDQNIISGDFTGNGAADIIAAFVDWDYLKANKELKYESFLFTPSVFNETIRHSFSGNEETRHIIGTMIDHKNEVSVIDFDGNGKQNIMVQHLQGCSIYEIAWCSNNEIFFVEIYSNSFPNRNVSIEAFGDFNGDGKTDFVYALNTGYCLYHKEHYPINIKVSYSTGTEFINDDKIYHLGGENVTFTKVYPAKFNHHDRTDLLVKIQHGESLCARTINFQTFSSTGLYEFEEKHLFKKSPLKSSIPVYEQTYTGNNINTKTNSFYIADFIGDGISDILYIDRLADINNTPNYSRGIYLNTRDFSTFVSEIRDGLGNKHKFEYSWISNTNHYEPNYSTIMASSNIHTNPSANFTKQLFPEFIKPIPIVTKLKIDNAYDESYPGGSFNVRSYYYKGSMFDINKKEWIGFYKMNQNQLVNLAPENSNQMNFLSQSMKTLTKPLYYGVSVNSNSFWETGGNNPIFKDETSYKIIKPNPQNSKVFYFYIDNKTETDSYNNTTTTSYSRDVNNNITNASTNFNNGEIVSNTIYDYIDSGIGIPDKVSNKTTTTVRQGQDPFTDIISFSYDEKGNLISETDVITNISVSYHDINKHGLPTKIQTTYPDKSAKTMLNKYSYCSRFIIRQTNHLLKEKNFIFNYNTGNLKEKKDFYGHIYSYDYDGFNRPVKKTCPLGIVTNIKYNWASCENNPNIVYSVKTSSDNGQYQKQYFDKLQRAIRDETTTYNNNKVFNDRRFNRLGNLSSVSDPYFEGQTPQKSYYDYYKNDINSNRLKTHTCARGFVTEYSYGNLKTTVNLPSGYEYTKSFDGGGNVVSISAPMNNTISFSYGSHGNLTKTEANNIINSKEYNEFAYQTKLTDDGSGTSEFYYHNDGMLKKQINAKGNTVNIFYDEYDRTTKMNLDDKTIHFSYFNEEENASLLKSVKCEISESYYYYDEFQRKNEKKIVIDNNEYRYNYSYNEFEKIDKLRYPNELEIEYIYDNNGLLIGIKNANNNKYIWQTSSYNEFGQLQEIFLKNNMRVEYKYDYNYLFLNEISFNTGLNPIFHFEYDYNPYSGNVIFRKDIINNITETFDYDDLNRLKEYTLQNLNTFSEYNIDYDLNGNIIMKSDVGNYIYDNVRVNAISQIEPFPESLYLETSAENQFVDYNSFNMPEKISQGDYKMKIYYSHYKTRIKSELFYNEELLFTRYYLDNYEIEISDGVKREYSYIPGPKGNIAVYITENGETTLYYLVKDIQNSILALVNSYGNIVEEQRFDPWGRYRCVVTGSSENYERIDLIFRAYTSHEMLPEFGLINMGARMYDPFIARVLSPDNFVQDPFNPQNYNRYSYCYNNPMMYVDPDGNFIWAITSFIIRGAIDLLSGNWQGWEGSGKKAVAAGITGLIGGGIGVEVTGSSLLNYSVGQIANNWLNNNFSFEVYHNNFYFSISPGLGYGMGNIFMGGNISLGYNLGNTSIFGGFGISNESLAWGANATYKGYGGGYYRTYYGSDIGPDYMSNEQTVGGIRYISPNGGFRLENDFLGDGNDRWRSSAVEISYKNFSLGTNLYNNYPSDKEVANTPDLRGRLNKYGNKAWKNGQSYYSPIWIGYRQGSNITRVGYSHPLVQDRTQNWVHRNGFLYTPIGRTHYFNKYCHFETGGYFQTGYNNPYSLW